MINYKEYCDICKFNKFTVNYDNKLLQYFYYDIYSNINHTYTKTNIFLYTNVEKICEKCLVFLLDNKELKYTNYNFDGSIDTLFTEYPKIKIMYIDFFMQYIKKVKVYKEHLDYVLNYLYENKDNLELINYEKIVNQLEKYKNNIL